MGRPKGSKNKMPVIQYDMAELQALQDGYAEELKTPKWSLQVDPENKYNLSQEHKDFIEYYLEYGAVVTAAKMVGIPMQTAMQYLNAYSSKQEIRRITLARKMHQCQQRMLNLDEIGGLITSTLLDDVSTQDKLSNKDKIGYYRLLLDIHDRKAQALLNGKVEALDIDFVDVSEQLEAMDVKSLQNLLDSANDASDKIVEKRKIINDIKFESKSSLSAEEEMMLNEQSIDDLKKLLDTIRGNNNGGGVC